MKSGAFGIIVSVCLSVTACTGHYKSDALQPEVVASSAGAVPAGQMPTSTKTAESAVVPDQVVVKFREGTDGQTIVHIQREVGLQMLKVISPPNLVLMRIEGGSSVEDVVSRLKAYPEVLYSEPNYKRSVKGN